MDAQTREAHRPRTTHVTRMHAACVGPCVGGLGSRAGGGRRRTTAPRAALALISRAV
jgi:hypothetical protein